MTAVVPRTIGQDLIEWATAKIAKFIVADGTRDMIAATIFMYPSLAFWTLLHSAADDALDLLLLGISDLLTG